MQLAWFHDYCVHLVHFSDLPSWHLAPVQPRHKQWYPFLVNPDWQVPLFLHGELPQGFWGKDYGKQNCLMFLSLSTSLREVSASSWFKENDKNFGRDNLQASFLRISPSYIQWALFWGVKQVKLNCSCYLRSNDAFFSEALPVLKVITKIVDPKIIIKSTFSKTTSVETKPSRRKTRLSESKWKRLADLV